MDEKKKDAQSPGKVWQQFERAVDFNNNQCDLYDTVETNENFFIGKQWEGVQANGLPTPVFNFLKRVTLFQVASVTTDNLKMQAVPLAAAGTGSDTQEIADIVNSEFDFLFEHNKICSIMREYMRNAAVDGDGCTYTYWDEDIDAGNGISGGLVTEIIENTRVHFGNPNSRLVQRQPWIIISSRERIDQVKRRAKEKGGKDYDTITADENTASPDKFRTDDRVTVLLKLWKSRETGTIWGYECTQDVCVREAWDLGLKLYPVTWLNWDYVQDCYHGQALITGLIPNQIFINKMYAMSMLSLMTTAYPKIIYDKTRVGRWDNRVGAAIGVSGGGVDNVAKIMDPAQISPQIAQFIELAVDQTQTFLGATSAALGDTRPDNTSAIIALQRASSVPAEITKQNLYQSIEDLGRIYIDFMGEYYGSRTISRPASEVLDPAIVRFAGLDASAVTPVEFDFGRLKDCPLSLKLDVGASSYWSEIASMQTLDNLLMQGKIELIDYLERVPDGYISKRQELIAKLKSAQAAASQIPIGPQMGGNPAVPDEQAEIPTQSGYSALQRKINETGVSA